jgi:hypothetical protein
VRSRTGAIALCLVASLALLATGAPVSAAPKRISGKLSKPGYTVIALAASGEAATAHARDRNFRLSPPSRRVTLHLRGPDGVYAGPVVIFGAGKRAIVGVRAGARLGEIKVAGRKGYAKVAKRAPAKSIVRALTARAKKGVPIGAGVFGRVRSKPPRNRILGDADFDGIHDTLDIDDDGDLILDNVDSASAARTADHAPGYPPGHPPGAPFNVLSTLSVPALREAANASPRHSADPSRPAFGDAEIDDRFKTFAALGFGAISGPGIVSTELDCGGLADPPTPALMYCSPGGTGFAYHPTRPLNPAEPPTEPFPGEPGDPDGFDRDGDGQGTLPPSRGAGAYLEPRVTTAEVKTGDLFIERGNDANGVEIKAFTTTLQYVFATPPMLASYDDGPGGIPHTQVQYPRPPGASDDLAVAPRPAGDPFAGDVVVTLTFWRPQRRRIENDPALGPGDSPTWTDIGLIRHGVMGRGIGGVHNCPQRAFLPETDDSLTDLPPGGTVIGGGGYEDTIHDRPANPAHTLTFTVNLSECLRAFGRESDLGAPGDRRIFALLSAGRGGQASHAMTFKRE